MLIDGERDAAIASLVHRTRSNRGLAKSQVEKIVEQKLAGNGFIEDVWYVTPQTLAGTGETVSTENAWTAVTVPTDRPYAFIAFEVKATSDTDVGTLYFRDFRTGAEVDVATVDADEDDAQPAPLYKVPLNGGSFDYKFVSSAGSPDFRVRYMGYPG